MNYQMIFTPPADIISYVSAPLLGTFRETEANLNKMILANVGNIQIKDCAMEIISNLEMVLRENRYAINFLPLPNSTAFADFYLEQKAESET